MANPRAIISFEQTHDPVRTFTADGVTIVYDLTKRYGSAAVGLAVSLSGDGIVQLASDGEAIVGKLMEVESDGKCAVWVKGAITLPAGNGASVTRGHQIVGALGAASAKGYIRDAASGTAGELVLARGQIWSVADTTNVVVEL